MTTKLIAVMFALLSREVPGVETEEKHAGYRESVQTLAELNQEVGAEGALVSASVDPYVLSAIQWYEARLRKDTKDGDCHETNGGRICDAVGVMQLSTGTAWTKDKTREELRDPKTSITIGYAVLKHWRKECGQEPHRWLAAYTMGKCPPKTSRGTFEGRRRCATVLSMLKKAEVDTSGWKCPAVVSQKTK